MTGPFFLLQDTDHRVGLFTWDPHQHRALPLPQGVRMYDLKRLGPTSARSLQRLAACIHAAREALLNHDVQEPQEIPPDVLIVIDPPIVLARRNDVVSLPLDRPAVLLGFGTAADAWTLARKGGGWIDVYNAWEAADSPSGLAIYNAEGNDGRFRRVNDPMDPPLRPEELPAPLAGEVPALELRFLEQEHINPSELFGAAAPSPPPPAAKRPDHNARLAFVVIGALALVLVAWLVGR